jgi:hypothetical protein
VAVLGLSLTADEVVWALVDAADGALLDHDALDRGAVDAQVQTCAAGAAVRSARAIARCGGCDIDRVRLTWSDDVARQGRDLLETLRDLGFGVVEAVPMSCALAAPVADDALEMAPRLALAYGAARAEVRSDEAITEPVTLLAPRSRRRPGRTAAMVVGAAAAAAAAAVFVVGGASPQVAPAATALEQAGISDQGWTSVLAPPADAPAPRIVAVPAAPQAHTVVAAQAPRTARPAPQRAAVTAAVAAPAPVPAAPLAAPVPAAAPAAVLPAEALPTEAPAAAPVAAPAEAVPAVAAPAVSAPAEALAVQSAPPAAEPHVAVSAQEHLPGIGPGPLPGPADEAAVPLPGPIPTVNGSTPAS